MNQMSTFALCVRLNRKWELGISTKMSTSPLIFLKLNYFRQSYLEIVLCSVSLLMHIWVQVEHSLLCANLVTIQADYMQVVFLEMVIEGFPNESTSIFFLKDQT